MNGTKEELIRKASDLLRSARHAVVFTGAGISTPSGIPDYRSRNTGLWTKTDPMKVSSLTAFRQHPDQFYEWLRPLAANIRAAKPNAAHLALVELEKAGILKAVVTQNIDGLHRRAGSQRVLEVHGTLNTLTCQRCGHSYPVEHYWDAFVDEGVSPRCQDDQENLKPDIVLFEEMLPMQTWRDSEAECSAADLVIVIGSSLEVGPANALPVYTLQNEGNLVINTLTPTHLDEYASVLLPFDVAEVIPAIARQVLS